MVELFFSFGYKTFNLPVLDYQYISRGQANFENEGKYGYIPLLTNYASYTTALEAPADSPGFSPD